MSDENDPDRIGLARWLDDGLARLEVWPYRPLLVGALVAAIIAVLGVGLATGRGPDDQPVEDAIPFAAEGDQGERTEPTAPGRSAEAAGTADSSSTTTVADLVVHVAGAVRSPGLVTVPPGARVDDAIRAAGGPGPAADLDRLNLARPVADGMQIRVPTMDEAAPAGPLISGPEIDEPDGSPGAASSGPVALNSASVDQLDTLPGVGPATAAAIVTWREENGGFRVVEDLLDVPGIGPAKLEALRDHVVV
ncbi:MAG: helix-hairpin-helix domain-containing protein [Actinomycetota bacterium]